jgi:hypothetical protein
MFFYYPQNKQLSIETVCCLVYYKKNNLQLMTNNHRLYVLYCIVCTLRRDMYSTYCLNKKKRIEQAPGFYNTVTAWSLVSLENAK